MSNINDLCFKIEHILATFEVGNDLKIDDIHIERDSHGGIKSVKAIASGEYRSGH